MDEAAAAADPPPALVVLAHRLGLDDFERNLLLLAAAPELSPEDIPALCGLAQGDGSRRYPTFALARAILPDPSWEAFAPYRPLRRWRLLEINQPGGAPLAASTLRADERIVNFIVGIVNYLDDRLASLLAVVEPWAQELPLAASQTAMVREIARAATALEGAPGAQVVQLIGPATAAKRIAAWQTADRMGRQLFRLGADDLPRDAASLETLAVLWVREQILWGPALYLDARETDRNNDAGAAVNRFLRGPAGSCFWKRATSGRGSADAVALVDVNKPEADEQAAEWSAALGDAAGDLPERLAGQFNLDVGVIRRLAHAALGKGTATRSRQRLWEEALANTRPHLETLAQRIDARANWRLIVLPKAQEEQLRQICDQVRYRRDVYDRLGLPRADEPRARHSELFTGESGTGKTMAAEVIATDLDLALYRIDLSQVVSKYIGETEKNLKNVFDAAKTAARSFSSMRRMRSSASAARSKTATTATPTSRSTTCSSGWRHIAGWRSWQRT